MMTKLTKLLQNVKANIKYFLKIIVEIPMIFKKFYDYWRNVYDNSNTIASRFNDQEAEIYNEHIWDTLYPTSNDWDKEYGPELEKDLLTTKQDLIFSTIKGNTCTIYVDSSYNKVEQMQIIKIDENIVYDIVVKDNQYGVISKVKLMNKTYKVTCNHIISLLDISMLRLYTAINPQLMVNTKKINMSSYKWLVPRGTKILWYTKNLEEDKHIVVDTKVTYGVPAYVKINGRASLTMIAVVITIPISRYFIYSGTLMECNKKPFIVTFVRHDDKQGISVIVAIAAMHHNYTIQAHNADE